jgi:hypothetical protein
MKDFNGGNGLSVCTLWNLGKCFKQRKEAKRMKRALLVAPSLGHVIARSGRDLSNATDGLTA